MPPMHGARQSSEPQQEDNDAPADVNEMTASKEEAIAAKKKKKLPLDIVVLSSIGLLLCAYLIFGSLKGFNFWRGHGGRGGGGDSSENQPDAFAHSFRGIESVCSFEPGVAVVEWGDAGCNATYEVFYETGGIVKSEKLSALSIELADLTPGETYSFWVSDGRGDCDVSLDVRVATVPPRLAAGVLTVENATLSTDGIVTIDANMLVTENVTVLATSFFLVRLIEPFEVDGDVARARIVNATARDAFDLLDYDASVRAFSANAYDTARRHLGRDAYSILHHVLEKSITFTRGPASLITTERLAAYVGAHLRWGDSFDDIEMTLTTKLVHVRSMRVELDSTNTVSVATSAPLWIGPKFGVNLPSILGVPILATMQPFVDLHALGTVQVETTASVDVSMNTTASVVASYKSNKLDANSSASVAYEREASVDASLAVFAVLSLPLRLEVALSGLFAIDFQAKPSFKLSAETSSDPVVTGLELKMFDLVATFELPLKAVVNDPGVLANAINVDFGSLYEARDTLVTLPNIAIGYSKPLACSSDGDRPQLTLHAEERQPFNARYLNSIVEPHAWDLVKSSENTTGWFLESFGLNVVLTASSPWNEISELSAGILVFQTTPAIPRTEASIVASFDLDKVSGKFECCTASDCDNATYFVCENALCLHTGNPRISLFWIGDDDLDLHVLTPDGNHIHYGTPKADGGHLDHDDIPSSQGSWIENVYWPDDGSAPSGRYEFFVHNFNQVGEADFWTLRAFRGKSVAAQYSGTLDDDAQSARFVHIN